MNMEFKKGDTVELVSNLYPRTKRPIYGTIWFKPKDPTKCITVLRDGIRWPEPYHPNHWKSVRSDSQKHL